MRGCGDAVRMRFRPSSHSPVCATGGRGARLYVEATTPGFRNSWNPFWPRARSSTSPPPELNRFICDNAELSSILRRGNPDPTSLDEEELFRFNFITRNYTNHVYKLFRLYERGAFPENEWKNVVLEAVQLFSLPGMARFKETNRYFADLWKEMDRYKLEEFSSFEFGDEPRQRS